MGRVLSIEMPDIAMLPNFGVLGNPAMGNIEDSLQEVFGDDWQQLYNLGMKVPAPERGEWFYDMIQLKRTGSIEYAKKNIIWNGKPVDIKTFIEGPYYLNKKDDIYPKLLDELVEINSGKYVEAIFVGGIGSGKTTGALYTQLYQLYLLSMMKNPHRSFGLDPSSEILFIFQSLNARLAKTLDYARFKSMVDGCQYFKDHFYYDKKLDSKMVFPRRIEVVPVSGLETAAIGQNVISGLLDEVNYMAMTDKSKHSVDGGTFDQATALYNSIARRRKSRFMASGRLPGVLCIVSSKRYPGQFTDIKEAEAKRDPTIYIYDKRVWEVKPAGSFSGVTFDIFIGDDSRKPRILDKEETVHPNDRHLVDHIPVEFREDFEKDIINALREIAGKSTLARHPFIVNTEAIALCMDRNNSIFSADSVDFVEDQLFLYPDNFYKPQLPRYAHIDLGITGDSAGLTIGTVTGFEKILREGMGISLAETLPRYYMDGSLEIRPPKGGEILFWKIRNVLYKLRELGLNIRWVSLDSFQCLCISSKVWTSKGYKLAGDIQVGDLVQSRIGTRAVTTTWDYGIRPCLKITTDKGQSITVTEHHKLEANTHWHYEKKLVRPTWGWVEAKDLKIGQTMRIWKEGFESSPSKPISLVVPEKTHFNHKDICLPSLLTEEVAEAISIYFGDGSFNGDTLQISSPDSRCSYLQKKMSDLFGVTFSIYKDKRKNAGSVCKSSSLLLQWFQLNGFIKGEDIPQAILSSPIEVQAAFIRGLFSTDGCVSGDYGVIISSSKIEWLRYIQQFCYSVFGMQSAINKGSTNSLSINRCYNLRLKSRMQFMANIGYIFEEDGKLLKEGVQHPKNLSLNSKIVSIEKVMAHVVDFEVEEDHAYIANGFVSHNSRDSMQTLRQKGFFTGLLSMDTSILPYEVTKSALYDRRVTMPVHAKLKKELASLEFDPVKGKVDHPAVAGASKDVSDSFAGVVHGLMSRREVWGFYGVDPVEMPAHIKAAPDKQKPPEVTAQISGESKFTEAERNEYQRMRGN